METMLWTKNHDQGTSDSESLSGDKLSYSQNLHAMLETFATTGCRHFQESDVSRYHAYDGCTWKRLAIVPGWRPNVLRQRVYDDLRVGSESSQYNAADLAVSELIVRVFATLPFQHRFQGFTRLTTRVTRELTIRAVRD